jgi:hypothetical protein
LSKTNGNWVARFQYTNSEAWDVITFGGVMSCKFRTKSGDGYDVSDANAHGGFPIKFQQIKHGIADGLLVELYDSDHCDCWMRFADGKAVKWFVGKGNNLLEIRLKTPLDYYKYMNGPHKRIRM